MVIFCVVWDGLMFGEYEMLVLGGLGDWGFFCGEWGIVGVGGS